MLDPLAIRPGDVVQMRKPHACGANQWTIVRTGVDVRIRCDQCGRTVLMRRTQFLRAARGVQPSRKDANEEGDRNAGSR